MITEKEVIYGILNTLRNNEHNNDERASERFLRHLLQRYRAKEIRIYYDNGYTVSDQVIQKKKIEFKIKPISSFVANESKLNPDKTGEYHSVLPDIIRLNNYGFHLEIQNIPIPIYTSHEYHLATKDRFEKKLVFAKTEENKIIIHVPLQSNCIEAGDNRLIRDYIYSPSHGNANKRKFDVNLHAIFNRPEDADGYDWETSIWPFPAERYDDFLSNLLRKEFGIMVNAKKDEIQNARADQVRYHDNSDINKTI